MRNRIWTELTQAKHNIEFSSLYADYQRKILRIFNICILIFSSSGIMGWTIWDKLPLVACIIIAGISLLRLLQPQLIMSESQIKDLDEIQRFYAGYYNKLEKLWYDFEANRLKEQDVTQIFFEIKQTEKDIDSKVAETIRSKPKHILKKSKVHSDQYFTNVFNT